MKEIWVNCAGGCSNTAVAKQAWSFSQGKSRLPWEVVLPATQRRWAVALVICSFPEPLSSSWLWHFLASFLKPQTRGEGVQMHSVSMALMLDGWVGRACLALSQGAIAQGPIDLNPWDAFKGRPYAPQASLNHPEITFTWSGVNQNIKWKERPILIAIENRKKLKYKLNM